MYQGARGTSRRMNVRMHACRSVHAIARELASRQAGQVHSPEPAPSMSLEGVDPHAGRHPPPQIT
jgi:hypothetical protein